MPRPRKTGAEIQTMQEKIVDTAYAILQENGIDEVSSRNIADHMGIAHMSLFTYFDNQQAILEALRIRIVQDWQARLHHFKDRAQTEEISGLVLEYLRTYDQFAHENPNLFRLAWVMPEKIKVDPEENRHNMRMNAETLAELLKLGMDNGTFTRRDSLLAAVTVLGMVNMPYILFLSGKMVDPILRNDMANEMFSAAMLYLKN